MGLINKRFDFVLFFDVKDGNPNGDPDAGNLPRLDAETGNGLVTDVCIKRKVRNYVQIVKEELEKKSDQKYDIYIKEKTVLGHAHIKAFKDLNIDLGQEAKRNVPDNLREIVQEISFPEGLSIKEDDSDDNLYLVVEADADKSFIKESIKDIEEIQKQKDLRKLIDEALKEAKPRKPKPEETDRGREWMCQNYYDIRAFGAVLSLKSAPNCGQVRGPVQMTFARSVEPVVALEHSITRVAKTTEERAAKGGSEMGRKYTIPYGLYRTHGFVSAHLADDTKFSENDLKLLWEALQNMFEHDHSAARGLMYTRRLIIFEHGTALGNKPSNELFERVTWERKTKSPARDFSDYKILLDGQELKETTKVIMV